MDNLTFELKTAGDDAPGSFEAIMSAPTLDRDNEIVDSKAFEPLPKHITIDIDHGLTVEKTVGSGTPYYDVDGLLKVKGTFASTPLGQLTRTLVKEGHIRHMSVVFHKPTREIDQVDGKQHVRKGELINATITGIPANTATAISAKVGARNAAKDLERLQTMHDHAVELGATCGEKHVQGVERPYLLEYEKYNAVAAQHNARTASKSTDTDTPTAAADEAAPAGAEVDVARARAKLILARAALALE